MGLVGNTVGVAQCTMRGVLEERNARTKLRGCPADSVVGTATVRVRFGSVAGRRRPLRHGNKVYEIAPAPGEPAAFAFTVGAFFPVRLDTSVLSNGDYGVRVTSPDITEAGETISVSITTWGVPADHDGPGSDVRWGGWGQRPPRPVFGGPSSGAVRVPLLTNPSQCSESLSRTFSADAWGDPGVFVPSEPLGSGH